MSYARRVRQIGLSRAQMPLLFLLIAAVGSLAISKSIILFIIILLKLKKWLRFPANFVCLCVSLRGILWNWLLFAENRGILPLIRQIWCVNGRKTPLITPHALLFYNEFASSRRIWRLNTKYKSDIVIRGEKWHNYQIKQDIDAWFVFVIRENNSNNYNLTQDLVGHLLFSLAKIRLILFNLVKINKKNTRRMRNPARLIRVCP